MKIPVILTITGTRTVSKWIKKIAFPATPNQGDFLIFEGVGSHSVKGRTWSESDNTYTISLEPHKSTKATTREQVKQHMESHGWELLSFDTFEELAS